MGAGHSVTALYEIVPADSPENVTAIDPLVYQQSKNTGGSDLLQVKIRYKKPGEETSQLMTHKVDGQAELAMTSENLRFAAAVVEYGMLLRNSEFKGQASYQQALALARGARGNDENGYRAEFIKLLEISQILDAR
jgi:Ca-activated chloride channel family protein